MSRICLFLFRWRPAKLWENDGKKNNERCIVLREKAEIEKQSRDEDMKLRREQLSLKRERFELEKKKGSRHWNMKSNNPQWCLNYSPSVFYK